MKNKKKTKKKFFFSLGAAGDHRARKISELFDGHPSNFQKKSGSNKIKICSPEI